MSIPPAPSHSTQHLSFCCSCPSPVPAIDWGSIRRRQLGAPHPKWGVGRTSARPAFALRLFVLFVPFVRFHVSTALPHESQPPWVFNTRFQHTSIRKSRTPKLYFFVLFLPALNTFVSVRSTGRLPRLPSIPDGRRAERGALAVLLLLLVRFSFAFTLPGCSIHIRSS